MAFTIGSTVAKDGAGTLIGGGLLSADIAGGGVGPVFFFKGIVDGLAGSNRLQITAANAAKVDGSAVTQPVSIATAPVLVAGSAIIGKVGLDQTTDGTTNKVAADLRVAGSAVATGSGANGSTVIRTALATDSPGIIATGTAGSASATVLTVQGIASMTPMLATVTNTALTNFGAGEYETVAASQTAQALGATGATGDYISGVLVIPATTSPGVVTLLDNAISIPVFVGGATSVSNLVPFFIPLGMVSVSGAWKITTGANVSCIGIGNFT